MHMMTDWSYAKRAIRDALHLPTPMRTEDRRVLEQVIFKHVLTLAWVRRVLFVGCDWYTKHYERSFFNKHDYWTLDCSERAARFGGTHHILDRVERLDQHFCEARFDLILLNGVYGFGLNTPNACERAFEHCHSRLAEHGQLVFGWNDIPARTPVALESIQSLRLFQPETFPPLGVWRYRTATPYNHTYDFYCKPGCQ